MPVKRCAGAIFVLLTIVFGSSGPVAGQKTTAVNEAKARFEQGQVLYKEKNYKGAAEAFRLAASADPKLLDAHRQFISASKMAARDEKSTEAPKVPTEVREYYDNLAQQHPDNAVYQWVLGEILTTYEPSSEKYFRRAVELDPKFADAYFKLSLLAEERGDNVQSVEYMRLAAVSAPDDPGYSFYYSGMFDHSDPQKYRELSLEVARRFPTSERGAQALYWLAQRGARDTKERIAILERLKSSFPPARYSWSESGMSQLFETYAETDPKKALVLALEMSKLLSGDESRKAEAKSWQGYADYQSALLKARALLKKKKPAEALAVLDKVTPPRFLDNVGAYHLLKAESHSKAGKDQVAYESLIKLIADQPDPALHEAALLYGRRIGKGSAQITTDIWRLRDEKARNATELGLGNYMTGQKVSLADYRGRIVLLNFWYPG